MMIPQAAPPGMTTNPAEIQHYFDLLFPDASDGAYVVLSRPHQGKLLSKWLFPSQIPQICGPLAKQATHSDMYINLGLRHPSCTPHPETRGNNEDVYGIGGLWVEFDHNGGRHRAKNLPTPDELLSFIHSLPFRFSLIVDSSGGYHCYALFKELWIFDTPAERDAAALLLKRFQRTIQIQAAAHNWKVDSTADLARVLRPAGTLNHKSGTPKPVTIAHEDAIRFNPSDLADAPWLVTIEDTYTPPTTTGDFPPTQLDPIVTVCAWLRHCRDDAITLPEPEWYGMLGIVVRCVDGEQIAHEWSAPYPRYSKDETAKKITHALAAAGPLNCSTIRYDKGADDYCRDCQHWGKIKSPIVLGMAGATAQDTPQGRNGHEGAASQATESLEDEPAPVAIPWPTMAPEAFYGLAGAIVRTIAPHTESDPVALLVQLLTMVGNCIGRIPYYRVEATRHYLNIFAVLVGKSAKARKGTSADHIKLLLKGIDPAWSTRVVGGMSSGEGIIWQVRDAVYGHNKAGEEVCLDDGVEDKRLCTLETEFARGLAKTNQEGNVLSAVLRQAWDSGDLRTLVSGRHKAPVVASNAHVSICAHITADEVRRLLTDTEAANGFGNRFLWVCVQRSKLLPRGGLYPETALKPLMEQLQGIILHARQITQMQRTEDAEKRWETIYTALAEEQSGLLGAITARAEAQVLRLSCLYALLDKTAMVEVGHLHAAYAVWRYCEDSARHIFGDMLGDPLADELRRMLRQAGKEGLTRTDINNAMGRNVKSAVIGQALARLQRDGFARMSIHKTAGRPVETWYGNTPRVNAHYEKNELNEKSPLPSDLNSFNSFNSSTQREDSNTLNSFNSFNSYTQVDGADYEEGMV